MNPFCESIRSEVNKVKSSSLLVHSDVFRARAAISPISDVGKILEQHIQALEFIANGKPLFFPSFNYDFTRSKLYQPHSDPSQLGPLTEFASVHEGKFTEHYLKNDKYEDIACLAKFRLSWLQGRGEFKMRLFGQSGD